MERKTFRQIYEAERAKPTAGQLFVTDISRVTHRAEKTVRMWLAGYAVPDELTRTVLAKHLRVDANDLFPKN